MAPGSTPIRRSPQHSGPSWASLDRAAAIVRAEQAGRDADGSPGWASSSDLAAAARPGGSAAVSAAGLGLPAHMPPPRTRLRRAALVRAAAAPPPGGQAATAATGSDPAQPADRPPVSAVATPHRGLGSRIADFFRRGAIRSGGAVGLWSGALPLDYHHKTALVTGASSAIGAAWAHRLALEGVGTLLLADHSAGDLEDDARSLRDTFRQARVEILPVDFTKRGAGEKLVEDQAQLGRKIDVVVHIAGFAEAGRFDLTDLVGHERTVQATLLSAVEITHACLRSLRADNRQGVIAAVVSRAAAESDSNNATYGASKRALLTFTQAWYEECRDTNVRVCALIAPPEKHAWLPWHGRQVASDNAGGAAKAVDLAINAIDDGKWCAVPSGTNLLKAQLLGSLRAVIGSAVVGAVRPDVNRAPEPEPTAPAPPRPALAAALPPATAAPRPLPGTSRRAAPTTATA